MLVMAEERQPVDTDDLVAAPLFCSRDRSEFTVIYVPETHLHILLVQREGFPQQRSEYARLHR